MKTVKTVLSVAEENTARAAAFCRQHRDLTTGEAAESLEPVDRIAHFLERYAPGDTGAESPFLVNTRSVTNLWKQYRRSKLSSRSAVLREANRRGLLAGLLSRAGKPVGRAEAIVAAADSAEGADSFGECSVPEHWRPIFKRAFVKAAVHAAHTERTVTAR